MRRTLRTTARFRTARFCAARLYFLAGLLAPAILVGCGGVGAGFATTVTDSVGVAVVTEAGIDHPLEWTAERILVISPADEDSAGFFEASDVDVLPGHRIVVLDRQGKKIVLFDEEGHLLAQYGREGSGPGEFQYPLELTVTPGGGVTVFDLMNRRLERFDSTLAPKAPDPFQVPYFGGRLAFAGPYLVLPTTDPTDLSSSTQILSALGPADSVEIVRYAREAGKPIQLESCGMGFSGMPRIFAPTTHWAAGQDGLVVVVGTGRYEVDLYRQPGFRLERRIRRAVPAIQATAEMAKASMGGAMRVMTSAGERVCDADEVVEQRGFAPQVPPISDVAVSPRGNIYLERWAPKDEPRSIDLLSPDGAYMGTLASGFPFPAAFLGDDRIVVTEEDEMGLRSVVVYRIER